VAAAYLLLSGVARFLVEFIKLNPRPCLGLTNSQVFSVLGVVGGLILLFLIFAKKHIRIPSLDPPN
jgi:phosphatidylglycerol:prolipoprotein diacylglycerol transferase